MLLTSRVPVGPRDSGAAGAGCPRSVVRGRVVRGEDARIEPSSDGIESRDREVAAHDPSAVPMVVVAVYRAPVARRGGVREGGCAVHVRVRVEVGVLLTPQAAELRISQTSDQSARAAAVR